MAHGAREVREQVFSVGGEVRVIRGKARVQLGHL